MIPYSPYYLNEEQYEFFLKRSRGYRPGDANLVKLFKSETHLGGTKFLVVLFTVNLKNGSVDRRVINSEDRLLKAI